MSYRLHSGPLTNTVQVIVDRNDMDLPDNGGTLESRDLKVISNTAEFGALTVHLAYLRARATLLDLDRAVFDAFRKRRSDACPARLLICHSIRIEPA